MSAMTALTAVWWWAPALFIAATLATAVATGVVLQLLRRRAILDHPNERSSHAYPTPRGGGIAVIAVLIPSWIVIGALGAETSWSFWLAIAGLLALAALSWIDDLYSLSPALRIVCHVLTVALVLAALPADARVFQGLLPPLLDRLAAGLLWIWFLNLFNFMDGIDGISGVEAVTIALGLFLVAAASGEGAHGESLLALTLSGTGLGFLLWNWHPARLFLGDVGSVPLGFALGWLLLQAAIAGHWAAAIILPLYYLADATITIVRRALRGARIWQAHREHFYQKAAARGRDHAAISSEIGLANMALVGLALLAEHHEADGKRAAVVAAGAVVALLLLHLAGVWRRARS